jgi:rubrerythrin
MKAKESPVAKQTEDLLYQALETELGGVEVYRMAILCARNEDLKEEWTRYLAQTQRHVEIVRGIFERLGLDPEATTPGRLIVRDKGRALVSAMQKGLKNAPEAAQIVAAECVVDAETKDHANWSLIGALSATATGDARNVLAEAYAQVEDEEDEHLYHTKGWCRELWLEALGLEAQLPPPEEEREVHSAAEAAQAERDRKLQLVKKSRAR